MSLFMLIVLNILFFPIYLLGVLFSIILCFLPLFPTRVAKENFQLYLGCNAFEARIRVIGLYVNYLFTFVEYVVFLPLGLSQALNLSSYQSFIRSHFDKNGMIFLSGHIGNVEATGWLTSKCLNEFNKKVVCLAKPSPYGWLTKFIVKYRKLLNIEIILNNHRHVFQEMKQTLHEGHGMALILDQKPLKGGLFLPFFGKMAAFPYHGLHKLLGHNAAVTFLCTKRVFPGCFFIEFQLGKASNSAQYSDPKDIFIDYVNWLESVIRKAPNQWSWDYKKWSRKSKVM